MISDAATDGILIVRYLFGFRGEALIDAAVGPEAVRTTASDITSFLDGFQNGPSAPPAGVSASVSTPEPTSDAVHTMKKTNSVEIANTSSLMPSFFVSPENDADLFVEPKDKQIAVPPPKRDEDIPPVEFPDSTEWLDVI